MAALIRELSVSISNARIENVYQIGHKTLILRLHKPNSPTIQLVIETGKRFHLTDYSLERPPKPPDFCMILRKYLSGGMVEEIAQHEFERIITLRVRTKQGVMSLTIELFGDGNAILVDSQSVIIAAIVYKRMRDRNILKKETFQHAPASGRNPFNLSRAQLDSISNYGRLEAVRALTRFLSIGGLYAEEVLLRANVDKNIACDQLSPEQIDALFEALEAILSILQKGQLDPVIVVDDKGGWVDATPFRLKRYEDLVTKPYNSFSQALDDYFSQTGRVAQISEVQGKYEKELAKQQRMQQEQQTMLQEAKKAIEQNKRIADLIYSRLGELQFLQQRILEAMNAGEKWDQIAAKLEKERELGHSPAIYYDSFNIKNLTLNISIDGVIFPIQVKRSVQANAADYYGRMKKAERKLEGSEKALRETQQRIEELGKEWTSKIEKTRIEAPTKQVRRDWYEKFRWFVSSNGFLVIGGRDATTNEIIIKKHLEPQDIVLHADVVGAPFVVVKSQGKTPTNEVIQEAAQFAASYSRAWGALLGAVDVYWVKPSKVSKSSPSGQYLEKGAFIIQSPKNYVRQVPLRLAIGLQKTDERFRVIGGPVEAVRKQTGVFIEIAPGGESSAKLAKQLRHLLSKRARKEDQETIQKVRIEEIQQFIPMGKGTIITGKK